MMGMKRLKWLLFLWILILQLTFMMIFLLLCLEKRKLELCCKEINANLRTWMKLLLYQLTWKVFMWLMVWSIRCLAAHQRVKNVLPIPPQINDTKTIIIWSKRASNIRGQTILGKQQSWLNFGYHEFHWWFAVLTTVTGLLRSMITRQCRK